MKKMTGYELFLAGLNENYGNQTYRGKGPDDHYYVSDPNRGKTSGNGAGFKANFTEIGYFAADGAFIADQCIKDLDRMVAGQRDAQNEISEDLHETLKHELQQAKIKFKELSEIMDRASSAWEQMVDEHL
jgi:hypothetical protein